MFPDYHRVGGGGAKTVADNSFISSPVFEKNKKGFL